MKRHPPTESRERSSPELSDSETVAAFSPPLRQVGSVPPALLLVASVVLFFAGAMLGAALGSELLSVAGACVGPLGTVTALIGAFRQLQRRVRGDQREGDHSLAVLVCLMLVGAVSLIAFAVWLFLMSVGNAAD